jgi:hypothetical protein
MKKEVVSDWGTRGEWIFGGIWTVWLLWCSVVDTGNGTYTMRCDAMHNVRGLSFFRLSTSH